MIIPLIFITSTLAVVTYMAVSEYRQGRAIRELKRNGVSWREDPTGLKFLNVPGNYFAWNYTGLLKLWREYQAKPGAA